MLLLTFLLILVLLGRIGSVHEIPSRRLTLFLTSRTEATKADDGHQSQKDHRCDANCHDDRRWYGRANTRHHFGRLTAMHCVSVAEAYAHVAGRWYIRDLGVRIDAIPGLPGSIRLAQIHLTQGRIRVMAYPQKVEPMPLTSKQYLPVSSVGLTSKTFEFESYTDWSGFLISEEKPSMIP